jgi:hypothetical protein
MSINIKIVEIDQATQTVVVKYASENSKKNIDEYPGVAFQITNYNVKNLEEFVEAIRPQISLYVWQRDQAENPPEPIDISTWGGYSTEVERYVPPVDPVLESQLIPVHVSAEVTL